MNDAARDDYFFELLTEEIPAWMLRARLDVLRTELVRLVREFTGVEPEPASIEVDATARRIFFRLASLPARQADRDEEVKGPPERVAFRDGEPTPALDGFLRKNQATREQVERRDGYVWIQRHVTGLSIAEYLAASLPPVIENLRWPRMMRFEGHTWIRPIHSIVSLYGGDEAPLEIFGVPSGRTTRGHRTRSTGTIEVDSYSDYLEKLERARVVAPADERVRRLRERSRELAAQAGGTPAEDESIWDQWRYLTESPGLVRAEFDSSFLRLPPEVLITVMRVHQKQLPIYVNDALSSSFLAVMDGDDDPEGFAASGNAFVTNARFADALFFYETDRKRTLAERVEELSRLQFQERLGDYREKTRRIAAIAESIRAASRATVAPEILREAAELCKVDLLTEMVKELTELQGKIGGIYAREEGKPSELWQAIYDHYLPVSVDDALPRGEAGAILSLADRLDTVTGFFRIGLQPSGSRDPFALRRAAQGAVLILFNRDGWSLDVAIDELLEIAAREHGAGQDEAARLIEDLRLFFEERVRGVLEGPFGFAYDEVAAAMAAGWSRSLPDLRDRIVALREIRNRPAFLSILDSAKRIANITPEGFSGALQDTRLDHPTEERLAELARLVGEQIDELVEKREYGAALESFSALAPELEQFFNDVMVLVDDADVRTNRLALLNLAGSAVGRIADVTRIVVDRSDYRGNR